MTAALYRRWVALCALAELVGIGAGAAWWFGADRVNPDPSSLAGKLAMLVAKAGSGVVEGLVLGLVQASLLKRLFPALSVRGYVAATACVAVAGWAAGSAVPIFGAPEAGETAFEPSLAATAMFASVFGAVVGLVFGAAQAWPLARAARGAGWWIAVNALGWAIALPTIYLAASAPTEATLPLTVALGLGAGAVAGLILGAVTGGAFRFMSPRNVAASA